MDIVRHRCSVSLTNVVTYLLTYNVTESTVEICRRHDPKKTKTENNVIKR